MMKISSLLSFVSEHIIYTFDSMAVFFCISTQGLQSNFEIGGWGALLVTQYWGAQDTFSY